MVDLQHSESAVRRPRTSGKTRRPAVAAETRVTRTRSEHREPPSLELGSGPVAVQVRIGERWIAGQALARRTDQGGGVEVLLSHHGHLVWVDQQQVRLS
ncbi:MAG: hypothetical protein QOG10_4532 [Kribbellaceae bacterium]|jgi:hypothetical protein|nr:hypothetical protein [Kribbellaceae bacterium]